jgi:hypothetical protein
MCVFTRRFWKALRYRLGILGVGLVYLVAALEIPLPVFVHKISSQPFPCQDHACGCQTAEQCWSHCCCFTVEERWTWAREHNVDPPAYAEKPAPPSSPPKVGGDEGGHGWNTVKLRDRDCDTTAAAKDCCCCTHEPAAPAKEHSDASGRWITMMTTWRCQGYSTLWISAGAVLPVSSLTLSLDFAPPSRVCLPSLRADAVPSTPPDPPPRLSLV